jgi:hypothetical protein
MTAESRVAMACGEWLLAHLRDFRIDWHGDAVRVIRCLQPYAELSMLASTARMCSGSHSQALQRDLVEWLAGNAPFPDSVIPVVREFPHSLIEFGIIWRQLEQLGLH